MPFTKKEKNRAQCRAWGWLGLTGKTPGRRGWEGWGKVSAAQSLAEAAEMTKRAAALGPTARTQGFVGRNGGCKSLAIANHHSKNYFYVSGK